MSEIKVKLDDRASAVMSEMKKYSDKLSVDVKDAVKVVSDECLKDIKYNSPHKSGDYRRGWKKTVIDENATRLVVSIHNKDHYRLTHLLENGHIIVNQYGTYAGRTRAYPHIRPAEKKASEALVKAIEGEI